jgi:hypothetical protein
MHDKRQSVSQYSGRYLNSRTLDYDAELADTPKGTFDLSQRFRVSSFKVTISACSDA